MPRIDALLTAMVTNHAESVRLADGDVAYLVLRGTQHPLTRQPLGAGQLVALLSEMAPPHVTPALSAGKPLEFLYKNADGAFLTRLENDGDKVWATVSPAPANGANGNGHAASAIAEAQESPAESNGNGVAKEASPPPVRAEPVRVEPVRPEPVRAVIESDVSDEPARTEIDGLLRKLVETSASDLHLR